MKKTSLSLLLSLIYLVPFHLCASHNPSRYMPFLERPDNYQSRQKSYFHTGIFHTNASRGFNNGGGTQGIPELWGKYDLKDMIFALQTVKGAAFTNPLQEATGVDKFNGLSIPFDVDGKIVSEGIFLSALFETGWCGLSFGFWIPFMNVRAKTRYRLDRPGFVEFTPIDIVGFDPNDPILDDIEEQLDSARRLIHEEIGFKQNDWRETGAGDLDLFVRWSQSFDYQLMIRKTNLNLQFGVLIPSGKRRDIDFPASVPFMGNGHWGIYFDFCPEFELKEDLVVGCMFGGMFQFSRTRLDRIPVFKEPAIFSPLVGNLKTERGGTFKLSPYISFNNMFSGLHGQLRYTYLRHSDDDFKDKRCDKTIPSFRNIPSRDEQTFFDDGSKLFEAIDNEDVNKNFRNKIDQTEWRSHYVTIQATYDTKSAGWNCWFKPNFYLAYDLPVSGSNNCKTHHVTLGVELHF